MARIARPKTVRRSILSMLIMALVLGLAAGCAFLDDLDEALYPTSTPAAGEPTQSAPQSETDPTAIFTAAPTFTWPAPTHTPAPQEQAEAPTAAPPPTANPIASQNSHLVYALGGGILRGDYMGRSPVEVASVPQIESFDFDSGLLAMARNQHVDMIDLNQGALTSFDVALGVEIEFSQVIWGRVGSALLYAAQIEDATAGTYGRSVELVALARDGRELGRALLHDVTGLHLLSYDDAANRAWLIPLRGQPEFSELQVYDLGSGKLVQTMPVQGNGVASVSADGSRLLAAQSAGDKEIADLWIYDLSKPSDMAPQVWQHPENTHSDAHIWSPDGSKVAFLLRDGTSYANASQGLGLLVLDMASMQAQKVLDEASVSSTLLSWTPDGSQIIGLHRSETDGSHYFAVRPDGGDRQILPMSVDATLLGWMPLVSGTEVPLVVIDPWRIRFLDAEGSPSALASVVAEFVAAQIQTPEVELSTRLSGYLQEAGWITPPTQISVKRLTDGVFMALLPDNGIYVLESGQASLVARGHVLLDARIEANDLGVIFGSVSNGQVQPTYLVYRRQSDSTWAALWSPQGQRDWIATDGEITFAGEGLAQVQVRGSSFGLDLGQEQIFVECRACPHRWLVAQWQREVDGYTRQTNLSADATLSEMTWEMTELRPYSLTHEVLRRLRQARATDNLATQAAVDQARALGLLEKDLMLRPDSETPDGITFSSLDGSQRFVARIQGPQVTQFEQGE